MCHTSPFTEKVPVNRIEFNESRLIAEFPLLPGQRRKTLCDALQFRT